MHIRSFESVDSTNSYLERNAAAISADTMVAAKEQTAGRGQRGNSWEAEPGKNLTFSMLHRPVAYKASEQFHMSEAVALAMTDFLALHGIDAKVKWPNDIYVGDRKICGILIKHSLTGSCIEYSIIGAGVNVNQTEFRSDAPNPVSMANITGHIYDMDVLLKEMSRCLESRLAGICDDSSKANVHEEFKARLWRGDGGMYPFRDTATGEEFMAKISDVHPQGFLKLVDAEETERVYAFKEVVFIVAFSSKKPSRSV